MVVFKFAYSKGDEHFWFSLKSQYWWPSLVISGALVVYQFSESLLLTLFLFPLIQFSVSLRHSGILSALASVAGILLCAAGTIVLLFGSYLAHP
jgi:hypothetical protein